MEHNEINPQPRGGEPGVSSGDPLEADSLSAARARGEFLDFVDLHYHRLVGLLMWSGAERQDAEDAVQEALLQGWRAVLSGRWSTIGNPAGWIRRVVWNTYRRPPGQKRTQPPIAHGSELPDRPSPGSDHAGLTDEALLVLHTLRRLPDELRLIMALTIDGATDTETAQLLNLTPQKVRDLRKSARTVLRRSLAPYLHRKEDVR
ncbi:RNA polymerase sigma factor [Streptomyces chartreusis]|uniref:RNA polymerase sigma factor n=1 Tax=Streptomyces chartreusis TaxID=1969 RepID=UPI0035E0E4A9